MSGLCAVRGNRTIPCDGEYVPSEGCCLRHACLFDIWIAEHGGFRVYGFDGETQGPRTEAGKRRWKRAKFHEWLDTQTIQMVRRMLGERPREEGK